MLLVVAIVSFLFSLPTSHALQQLTHADVTWKLRPPPEMPFLQKLQYKLGGPLLRLQCQLAGNDPPLLLYPNARTVLLEAWHKNQKIGRFGLTVEPGPTTPELVEAVETLFNRQMIITPAAAIIYMFVEKEYRGRGVGKLALETIGILQSAKGCYFTLLVADDDSTMKLVRWYEKHGFVCAPSLQDMMGSPDKRFGVAMIGPTQSEFPKDCVVEWW